MTAMSLRDLFDKMRKIDFCILSTAEAGGPISARPMSNNGEVEYDGDSWSFSIKDTRKVAAIRKCRQSEAHAAWPGVRGRSPGGSLPSGPNLRECCQRRKGDV
eukprot:gene61266-biopygen44473